MLKNVKVGKETRISTRSNGGYSPLGSPAEMHGSRMVTKCIPIWGIVKDQGKMFHIMETVMKIVIWGILKDPPHEDCAQTRTVPRTRWGWPWSRAPCPWCRCHVFNIWVDLSMMSMSPHWASKGIPASLVRCQAASMLVRLTGRKKTWVPRRCLHLLYPHRQRWKPRAQYGGT